MKIEVQYYPLENCSGNLCKIIVEATDYGSAAQIVMKKGVRLPPLRLYLLPGAILQSTVR